MKKLLALFIALLLALPLCIAFPVSATPEAVYVSGNGDDSNSGLTADAPVLTLKKAVDLLGGATAEGTVIITDTLTHGEWALPAAKKITITGLNSDSTIVFSRIGSGVHVKSDLTFDDINVKIPAAGYYPLYCNGCTVEFTENTRCGAVDGSTTEKSYISLVGGSNSLDNLQGVNLILNGGTFYGIIIGSTLDKVIDGNAFLTVGEKAIVRQNITVTGGGASAMQDINVNIKGTVNGKLDFSNSSENEIYGDISVALNGGTVSEICPCASNNFREGAKGTVNFSHAPSCTDDMVTAIEAAGFNVIPYIADAPCFAGVQTALNSVEGFSKVRFAATIDSLDYKNVGFDITASYGEGLSKAFDKINCQYVYSGLSGIKDGDQIIITAKECNGEYIYALAIEAIPLSVMEGVTFTVKPFAEKTDGTIVYGNSYLVKYVNGECISVDYAN